MEQCFTSKPKTVGRNVISSTQKSNDFEDNDENILHTSNGSFMDLDLFKLINDLLITLCIEECSTHNDKDTKECLCLKILMNFYDYIEKCKKGNILHVFLRTLFKISRAIINSHTTTSCYVLDTFQQTIYVLRELGESSEFRQESITGSFWILKTLLEFSEISSITDIVRSANNLLDKWTNLEEIMDMYLFKIICGFISDLKIAKLDFLHACRCSKKKHKNCLKRYSHFTHHHQEILSIYDNCIVKRLSILLINYLNKLDDLALTISLGEIRKCGLCCCLSIEKVTSSLNRNKENVQLTVNWIINSVLYELGGYDADYSFCSICQASNVDRWNSLSKFIHYIDPKTKNINSETIAKVDLSKFEDLIKYGSENLVKALLEKIYVNLVKQSGLKFHDKILNHILKVFFLSLKNSKLCDFFLDKIGIKIFQWNNTCLSLVFKCFIQIISLKKDNVQDIGEIIFKMVKKQGLTLEESTDLWKSVHLLLYYSEDARNLFVKCNGTREAMDTAKINIEKFQDNNCEGLTVNFAIALACSVLSCEDVSNSQSNITNF